MYLKKEVTINQFIYHYNGKNPKDNLKWLYTLSETIIHHRKILKIVFESLKIPDSVSHSI